MSTKQRSKEARQYSFEACPHEGSTLARFERLTSRGDRVVEHFGAPIHLLLEEQQPRPPLTQPRGRARGILRLHDRLAVAGP